MRFVFASLALLAASLCAAQEGAGFNVVDGRPAAEKSDKNYSLMITSCNYGVRRFGDKKAPGRIEALRTDLGTLKGAALAGKTLQVPRYDIYFNNAAWLRASMNSTYGGAIINSLKGYGVDCPREKMDAGWFEASELADPPHPPIIVEMKVVLDGVPHEIRVVHTTSVDYVRVPSFKKPEDQAEVKAAMRKAAEALAAQLP